MHIHSTPHAPFVMAHWSFVGQVAATVLCSFQVSGPADSQSEMVGALLKSRAWSTPLNYRRSSVGAIWGKIRQQKTSHLHFVYLVLSGDGIFLPQVQYGLLQHKGPTPMLIRKMMVLRKYSKELQDFATPLKQHKYLLLNNKYLLVVF